jgi:hypothetical protein
LVLRVSIALLRLLPVDQMDRASFLETHCNPGQRPGLPRSGITGYW